MSTIKGYILLIRAHFENVLCYEINIFEYLYDLGISMGSNDIYNQYLLGCTKKTLLSPNFIKLGHYVWLGINKRHAKYLRKISIPYARARVFCILHVNAC